MWIQTSPYMPYIVSAFSVALLFMGALWWRSLRDLRRSSSDES
ncbi:MAG: heme exporter protein CcmD [bacterium]|nr:heme exporter protein CcmD [bacterium]